MKQTSQGRPQSRGPVWVQECPLGDISERNFFAVAMTTIECSEGLTQSYSSQRTVLHYQTLPSTETKLSLALLVTQVDEKPVHNDLTWEPDFIFTCKQKLFSVQLYYTPNFPRMLLAHKSREDGSSPKHGVVSHYVKSCHPRQDHSWCL